RTQGCAAVALRTRLLSASRSSWTRERWSIRCEASSTTVLPPPRFVGPREPSAVLGAKRRPMGQARLTHACWPRVRPADRQESRMPPLKEELGGKMAKRRSKDVNRIVPVEDYEHRDAKRTNNPPAGLAHLDR